MQANPFHARNISHLADEFGNMMLAVNIYTIVGEFLSDNLKLLYAFSYQSRTSCRISSFGRETCLPVMIGMAQ